MTNIEGKKIYCRSTEEKILMAWVERKSKKISIRDSVVIDSDVAIHYRLWNTNLVEKLKDDIYINISGNMEEVDRYYKGYNYYPHREYIISNTTKSRLNAFLNYYGFNSLEVHSSMKDWSVKYNGEKLDIDSFYKLDFASHKLVKVNK